MSPGRADELQRCTQLTRPAQLLPGGVAQSGIVQASLQTAQVPHLVGIQPPNPLLTMSAELTPRGVFRATVLQSTAGKKNKNKTKKSTINLPHWHEMSYITDSAFLNHTGFRCETQTPAAVSSLSTKWSSWLPKTNRQLSGHLEV